MAKTRFRVTGGSITEDIEAANGAEAQRKFAANRADAANAGPYRVEAIQTLPVDEPPAHLYKVTWGPDEKIVEAVHEDDAWTQFVGGDESSQAWKYPNLHRRVIEDLGPVGVKEKSEDSETAEGVSPVAEQNATDAIDHISRMRSPELLQDVVDHDQRVSVQKAAQKRLEELGG